MVSWPQATRGDMFNKRKKVKLTFHTSGTQQLVDMFSANNGHKLMPDWARSLGKSTNENILNMNTCPGFVDLLKKSVALPLWMDHRITYQGSQLLDVQLPGVSDKQILKFVQQHHSSQWGNAFKQSSHVKLMSPWLVTCDSDLEWLMHDPTWHKNNSMGQYTLTPGLLNFKYQSGTAVNMFLTPSEKPNTITLEAGTIIAYLTPLADVDIEIECKRVSDDEWYSLLKHQFTFTNMYNKTKKFLNRGSK